MDDACRQIHADAHPDFDNLDRGVLFAAIGGVIFNGLEASLPGIMLTIAATMLYGLARNRIANIDAFENMDNPPACLNVELRYFTLWCQWLASRQLRDGLLGDLVDPAMGNTPEAAQQYLRETLCLATGIRIKEKILTLLWLDRHL
ncbi:MAG: hypothetical protein COB33_004830 [Thiotrichaceae bacterium]|nr:hypothetical protein [Thiotrichaceae bacterium]PCI10250.1 MAG: hypothetical protein COB71_13065 [Thiotrichales bacterium]PCI12212.1 MAG: hypothetical protein COB71_09925 [Thiotrichales bacterium]